jgi:hypothetical protein
VPVASGCDLCQYPSSDGVGLGRDADNELHPVCRDRWFGAEALVESNRGVQINVVGRC